LTVTLTSGAGTKVGLSDPVVLHGKAIAQRIKGTPGITGLSLPRVHIDGEVWHLKKKSKTHVGVSTCFFKASSSYIDTWGAVEVILHQKSGL